MVRVNKQLSEERTIAEGNPVTVYDLLDGQQRLTTFQSFQRTINLLLLDSSETMDLNDIVTAFKHHQLQYGLNGDSTQQELYKWKLVTKQIGHPNTDAEDFAKEINALRFQNLCYSTHLTAIRHFAEYEPEDYREAFKNLFDENVDLHSA